MTSYHAIFTLATRRALLTSVAGTIGRHVRVDYRRVNKSLKIFERCRSIYSLIILENYMQVLWIWEHVGTCRLKYCENRKVENGELSVGRASKRSGAGGDALSFTSRHAMNSDAQRGSRDTLGQSFPLATPLEEEHPSTVVCIGRPPPVATPPAPKATTPDRSQLQKRLDSLRARLKSGSPFYLTKSKSSERCNTPIVSEITKQRRRSKNKKASVVTGEGESPPTEEQRDREGRGAGAIVRKLSELGRSRRDDSAVPPEPASLNTVVNFNAKSVSGGEEDISRSGFTEAALKMEDSTGNQSSSDAEPHSVASSREGVMTSEEIVQLDREEKAKINDSKGCDPTAVVVDHPVSTLPFAKSSWKRTRSTHDLVRPVETPSPESASRRRIAFVSQASVCLSEDNWAREGDRPADVTGAALLRMVELARLKLELDSGGAGNSGSSEEAETHAMTPVPHGDLIAANTQSDAVAASMGAGAALVSSHATAAGGERREHLYKILVIGELGTGKTSIIKRYVHQFFSQHYRATIGVDFALKVLNWDAQTVIRLQLWDIAGQERFGNMTRVYYKEAVGAFVVFDVTRVATFDAVVKWKMDLDSKVQLPDGSPIPCILLANKCDQQKEGIVNTPSKMDEYCREKGFAGWFETSAKENVNIEEAARSLVNKILLNDKLLQSSESRDSERFSLEQRAANGRDAAAAGSKTCAC